MEQMEQIMKNLEMMERMASTDTAKPADPSLVKYSAKADTPKFELMNIPAEVRCIIWEWLLIAEDLETVVPGKYLFDRCGQRIEVDARRLPILTVNRRAREELAPILFAKRLVFTRLYEIGSRIPRDLVHLPPFFRECIKKVSVEIGCCNSFDQNYGNFIIPYLPLCNNLNAIELHFSPRFYRLIFDDTKAGEAKKYLMFTRLVRLVVCLLNFPFKDLKVTVGDVHSGGKASNKVHETESEEEETDEPKVLSAETLKAKKAHFDATYANIFTQASRHRDYILSLPTLIPRRKIQPVYQFYQTKMEEKMAQMIMDVETDLHFPNPAATPEMMKLSIEELLVRETKGVYEEWLLAKYRIPRNLVELRLMQHESNWKAVGWEDMMLLGVRPTDDEE